MPPYNVAQTRIFTKLPYEYTRLLRILQVPFDILLQKGSIFLVKFPKTVPVSTPIAPVFSFSYHHFV